MSSTLVSRLRDAREGPGHATPSRKGMPTAASPHVGTRLHPNERKDISHHAVSPKVTLMLAAPLARADSIRLSATVRVIARSNANRAIFARTIHAARAAVIARGPQLPSRLTSDLRCLAHDHIGGRGGSD